MSGEASGWVWRHSPLEGAAFTVHLAIADVVNDAHSNQFFMAAANLAEKARCSRSTVRAALQRLEELGLLERLEEPGIAQRLHRPVKYRLLLPAEPVADLRPRVAEERPGGSPTSGHGTQGLTQEEHSSSDSLPLAGLPVTPAAPEPARKPRPRNEIYDALAEVFPPQTKSEESRVGKASAEIAALKPRPAPYLVRAVARWVLSEFDNATVLAVPHHWTNGVRRVGGGPDVRNPAARRFWEEPSG